MQLGPLLITAAVAAIMLLIHGTWKKTRFGINLSNVFCPVCRIMIPMLWNRPRTMGEWIWGGATCRNCDCRMDKWGEPLKLHAPSFTDEGENEF